VKQHTKAIMRIIFGHMLFLVKQTLTLLPYFQVLIVGAVQFGAAVKAKKAGYDDTIQTGLSVGGTAAYGVFMITYRVIYYL